MALLALTLIRIPLANAGDPNEPAPPVSYHVGMRPRDTSPEAWKVQMDLMRKMSPEEKLQRTFEYSAFVRKFGEAGLRQKYPAGKRPRDLSASRPSATRRGFVCKGLRRRTAAMIDPLAEGLNELTSALTSLGIRFLVTGSLASSAHGVVRGTMDGDLVALIFPPQAKMLAKALGPGWYADLEMMEQAIRERRAFNLIHIASAMKFDVFPALTDFHDSELERATPTPLRIEGAKPCPVATAEDSLLSKLQWYRQGGEVSDRQWSDIGGILVQNPNLDWDYVNLWAARLGVTGLLEKARADSQL